MRPALIFVLIFTVVFGTSYWYVETASICPVPINYKVGEVDERFSISKEEVIKAISEVELIWETSVGRNLFEYNEKSDFTINLIYDERQQLASTEEEWRIELDLKETRSRQVIEEAKEMADDYQAAQKAYEIKRSEYENKLEKYNQEVETLNRQGGADSRTFSELQAEQKKLTKLRDELEVLEKELNSKIEKANELGQKGNKLIEEYNVDVVKYNEFYGNRDLYTQGDFQRDRINIYKFSNVTELKKVIVHEFGHSLGLGHVEGEESMMYYLMAKQPDSITLTEQDKKEFFTNCGQSESSAGKVRRIIRTILNN